MRRNLLSALTFVGGALLGAAFSGFGQVRDSEERTANPLVTGIGGVFFKAENPEALRGWYREHLGLEAGPQGVDFLWRDQDDPTRLSRTVWSVFARDSEYFGSSEQQFMVNYRVSDLDAVMTRLRAGGIEPVKATEEYDYGRFAWIEDGEGNRVELWEPREDPGR